MIPEPDAVAEKKKDYRNTVLVQLILLLSALILEDGLKLLNIDCPVWLFELWVLLVAAVYLFSLWDMLRNFTESVLVVRGVLTILVIDYAVIFTSSMLLRNLEFDRWLIRVLCHLGLTSVMVVVIAYALTDLFRSPRNTVDKLWGSACIYFMSGIAFASVLYGILLIDPNAFGPDFNPGRHYGYFESLYLSFNSLVGLDTAYPEAIRLVRNTTLLEGAWGQLYLVLLIGRVLAPQEGPDAS